MVKMVVQMGDLVTVNYTLTYKDGVIFDSTRYKDPLVFRVGELAFIPGIEAHVMGMAVGQNKRVELHPSFSFGPHDPSLVHEYPIHMLDPLPKVGDRIVVTMRDGFKLKATVVELGDQTVTLDGNPEQAGKEMVLYLEILDLVKVGDEE
ncbi:MAG: hypothetical protein CL521_05555 [Actinobacteria bacterium]|nr:hypothetical protein [Actinomycetota bacterium]